MLEKDIGLNNSLEHIINWEEDFKTRITYLKEISVIFEKKLHY